MAFAQHLTLDNVLKVLLAIAVGVLLYNIFFKKTENYYNYQSIDKISDHAYPMDYEEDDSDIPYEEPTEEYVPEDETEEVVDEEHDEEHDDVVDEVVLDESVDEELYEYEESDEPYDDSVEVVDAEDEDAEDEIPDEIYEEADEETETGDDITPLDSYEFLYASDVEDGLQENFVLYENDTAEDISYSPMKNAYLQ